MNCKEFENLVMSHDWLFEYQDSFDSDNFNKGYKERQVIDNVLKDNPEFQEIYNKHNPFKE